MTTPVEELRAHSASVPDRSQAKAQPSALLGSIALYPDALNALSLSASTVPSDLCPVRVLLPRRAARR